MPWQGRRRVTVNPSIVRTVHGCFDLSNKYANLLCAVSKDAK